MPDRRVTHSRKSAAGDILAIGRPGAEWSPLSTEIAIEELRSGRHTYFVQWPEVRTQVRAVDGPDGDYIRTDRDTTLRNNLRDLPDL